MKVKGLVPFAGEVNMAIDEVKEVSDAVGKDLIAAGYVEQVGGNKKAPADEKPEAAEAKKSEKPRKSAK